MDLQEKAPDNKKAALEINRSLPQGGYQSFFACRPDGPQGRKVNALGGAPASNLSLT